MRYCVIQWLFCYPQTLFCHHFNDKRGQSQHSHLSPPNGFGCRREDFFPHQELSLPKDSSSLFPLVPYFFIQLSYIHSPAAMSESFQSCPSGLYAKACSLLTMDRHVVSIQVKGWVPNSLGVLYFIPDPTVGTWYVYLHYLRILLPILWDLTLSSNSFHIIS